MKGGRSKTETKRTDSKYPLGHVIGGTVYPGLTLTAGTMWILNSLNIPLSVETVCVFTAQILSLFCMGNLPSHKVIGDVRGRGLMLGIELVTDRELKTPAKAETVHIMEQMKEMGVLIGKGGFHGNVFRITPPLCFTKEDLWGVLHALDYHHWHYNVKKLLPHKKHNGPRHVKGSGGYSYLLEPWWWAGMITIKRLQC
ncbi:hypothetical protein LOK49_LG15G00478 [Camellia lanceoleosa]|uniref:Uncharacterized protein n=1 Tax=Camellia lanceoleosa TaxID=1840588 RepID=A0ACC0F3R4_9ERIC|nr:hypothetical protein LOK49_LG15G00478 [Camellia lanceoleosa]